jgi:hypothetical protein
MALYQVAAAQQINHQDIDQIVQLLTGVMLDQPVTLARQDAAAALRLLGGNSGALDTFSQLGMGYAGTWQYQHWLSTRHNGGVAAGNQIKFWTSDGTAAGVFPTNAILGLTIDNGKITVPGGIIGGSLTLTGLPGVIVMQTAGSATIVGGTTGMTFANNANTIANLQWNDLGLMSIRNALSIPPSAGAAVAPTSYGTVPIKIAETVLGAAAASVTFSNIPQTFRSLQLYFFARNDSAASQLLYLQFNTDAAANYRYAGHEISTTGVSTPFGSSGDIGFRLTVTPGTNTGGATAWGSGFAVIPYYTDVTRFKAYQAHSWRDDVGVVGLNILSGDWFNVTPAAVTQIVLVMAAGNILAGSTFVLYGIP